jgi:hypothetical protein
MALPFLIVAITHSIKKLVTVLCTMKILPNMLLLCMEKYGKFHISKK